MGSNISFYKSPKTISYPMYFKFIHFLVSISYWNQFLSIPKLSHKEAPTVHWKTNRLWDDVINSKIKSLWTDVSNVCCSMLPMLTTNVYWCHWQSIGKTSAKHWQNIGNTLINQHFWLLGMAKVLMWVGVNILTHCIGFEIDCGWQTAHCIILGIGCHHWPNTPGLYFTLFVKRRLGEINFKPG
jgi:hypothetical protein